MPNNSRYESTFEKKKIFQLFTEDRDGEWSLIKKFEIGEFTFTSNVQKRRADLVDFRVFISYSPFDTLERFWKSTGRHSEKNGGHVAV